jgi:hypothetical protein
MEQHEVTATDQFVEDLTEKRADDDYYPPFTEISTLHP